MESKVARRTAVGALASTPLLAPLSRAAGSPCVRSVPNGHKCIDARQLVQTVRVFGGYPPKKIAQRPKKPCASVTSRRAAKNLCFHEGRVELNGLLGMRNGRFDTHLPVSDARKPVSINRIGRARLRQPFEFGTRPMQPADCHV